MTGCKSVFRQMTALFIPLLLLTGCVAKQVKPAATSSEIVRKASSGSPCWYNHPVNGNQIGQIGTVLDIYTGGRKSVTKSREKAARVLANYLGVPAESELFLVEDDQIKSITLGGHRIYFADEYRDAGLVHSYVLLDNPLSQSALRQASCFVSACEISQCNPGWLCAPAKGDKLAILGVSFQTASPSSQRKAAVANALFAAEYMYGVDVAVDQRLTTLASGGQTLNILDMQSGLQQKGHHKLPYLVSDQCSANGSLYTRVTLPTLQSSRMAVKSGDLSWMKNPKYKGFDGAVGSSEKMVASGLFSDQIKLAIKRGIIQLALEKESNISEDLLNIDYERGGSIYVSNINNQSRVDMKVKVLSMHITANESGVTQVYAWVGRLSQ